MSKLVFATSVLLVCALSFLTDTNSLTAQDDSAPQSGFNHIYVTVDQDTFDSLLASKFIWEQFAVTEHRTTANADGSGAYTGIYLYGENTYLEFVLPHTETSVPGDTGLAFGSDIAGDLANALQAISGSSDNAPITFSRTRTFEDAEVPWFDALVDPALLPMTSPQFVVWTMEYNEAFLTGWNPELTAEQNSITRSAVLDRYKAKSQLEVTGPEAPIFVDIVGVNVDAAKSFQEPFERWLGYMGYRQIDDASSWSGNASRIDCSYGVGPTVISEIHVKTMPFDVVPEPIVFSELVRLEFVDNQSAKWVITQPVRQLAEDEGRSQVEALLAEHLAADEQIKERFPGILTVLYEYLDEYEAMIDGEHATATSTLEMLNDALDSSVTLIGDNHGVKQAEDFFLFFMDGFIQSGKKPVVVIEYIYHEHQANVDEYLRGEINLDELREAVNFTESFGSWVWEDISRILVKAKEHGLDVIAGEEGSNNLRTRDAFTAKVIKDDFDQHGDENRQYLVFYGSVHMLGEGHLRDEIEQQGFVENTVIICYLMHTIDQFDLLMSDCILKQVKIGERTYYSPVHATVIDELTHHLSWKNLLLSIDANAIQ